MERMALYLVAALLIGFPGSSHGALYTLITPAVLRTDTEEQILVEAHGDNTPKQLDIFVHDFPRKQKTLFQTRVDMNPAGGMLVTPTIEIPANEVSTDSRQNQYVVVQVTGPQVRLEKVVLLSYQSSFLFIQTDKGIYTPGSPVLYRVFSMDHNTSKMNKTVIVEFQVRIVSAILLGTWKIVAKYKHSPENYTAYFDVRKYVLPSFEVRLQPSEKFFYIDGNENFHVSITARYLYGEEVEGVAFVLFGVKIDDAKKSIPDSLTRIPIIDGDGKATLKRDTFRSRFPNLNELVGHTLYASVTVMTESGEQGGIHIVTSPYQIHFTKTPKYFKPGLPYELTVYVTNPDGSPAAKVPVVSEAFHSEGTTLSDGTAKLFLNTPSNAQSLPITVRTNHEVFPRERQATKSMTATAYQTQGGSGNYLYVAITSTEIKPGDNLRVSFNVMGNTNSLNQIKYFTYLILNKGKIFKVGRQPRRDGQNLVTMNLHITPDLIPSFRFVAYYQVGNNEIVADSVWVDVKDTCMGTLVVKGENRIQMPGAAVKIKLEGDPGARVGLVAVDKAVYVLNDKYKISQAKIWDTIEKSDFGCTAGSGQNNLGVFEDSGLALTTSTNLNTKQRSAAKCPQPANRRRRSSVLLLDSKASKAAEFQDQDLRKCCEDVMHENPMGYTCEKRAKYIQEGDACKAAFLECCRYIKGVRDENQRESELFLARDLERLLRAHYTPQVSCLICRHEFYCHDQRDDESISDFVASLHNLGGACEFIMLQEAMQDHFVLGLKDQTLQSKRLMKPKITLKEAIDEAIAAEATKTSAATMGKMNRITTNPEGEKTTTTHFDELESESEYSGEEEEINRLRMERKWNDQGWKKREFLAQDVEGTTPHRMQVPGSHLPPLREERTHRKSLQIVQNSTKQKEVHPKYQRQRTYVVKVFSMAAKMVAGISHEIICGGVRWLILNRQQPDGAFKENAPVLSGTMQGGIQGAEEEVCLTAFILVALLESKTICNDYVNSLDSSIKKATNYLLKKYEKLQRPYTTALTAYALAAADQLNDDRVLMAASTGRDHWEEYNAHTHNIEGTSYALLALLKMKKFDQTGPIVRWLTDQNFYGETYGQTQATVMAFQALAEYEIQMPTHKDLNLDITIELPDREVPIRYRINYENALLARTVETKLNQDITVTASGDGKATMTILTFYNAQLQEKANVCNKFHLNVSVENIHLNAMGAKGALMLKICTRYLGEVDSTMTIIDISMLTGFLPDAEDLTRLSKGVDRYISRYEVDNNMAQKVAVIIYLNKVSHSEDECLQFKILKHFEVGFIQPGSVKVYSYYNLDEKCTKFYHPDKGTGLLNKICIGNVCRCAGETCSSLNHQERIDVPLQIEKACETNVDYVYKTKLLRIEEQDGNDIYVMDVLEVIKQGTDENPQAKTHQYISQRKCQEALNLKVNDDYLIWGSRSDLLPTKDKISYIITKNTWIERWPHEDECQEEEFQKLCDDFAQFSYTLTEFGCPT
uniref:Complement C3 n=1 Tax=Naja naja TaxID=35670 RepID=A0A8C7DXB0_NAJNA